MTILMDELQKAVHRKPVHMHECEPIAGRAGPPTFAKAVDLHTKYRNMF